MLRSVFESLLHVASLSFHNVFSSEQELFQFTHRLYINYFTSS